MAVIGCSSQHIRRYFSCSRLSAVQVEVYVLRELFQIQKCRCSDVALRAIGARSRSGSPVLARSVTGDQAFEFEVSADRTRSDGLACDKWLHVAAAPSHFEPLRATSSHHRAATNRESGSRCVHWCHTDRSSVLRKLHSSARDLVKKPTFVSKKKKNASNHFEVLSSHFEPL